MSMPTTQADPSRDDVVLLQFTEENVPPRTYSGKATGTKYRFGSDPEDSVRWVRKADVPGLMSLGYFKEHVETAKPLMAAGAPER